MGKYSASLRAVGDNAGVPATVELIDGQLSIASGDHDIGTWALSDIELEPVANGYRLAAEGDQIIIELKELDAFQEALSAGRFKRRYKLRGKEKKAAGPTARLAGSTATTPDRTSETKTKTRSRPKKKDKAKAKTDPVKPQKERSSKVEGLGSRVLAMLDHAVETSHKRFGPYLPDWLFSRAMFVILFLVLVVLILFPTMLLILGGVVIVLGAVAYSDPVLASKVLPGRTQPPQALVAGVAILLLGVLVGMLVS